MKKEQEGRKKSKGKRKEGVRNDKCKRIKPGKVLESWGVVHSLGQSAHEGLPEQTNSTLCIGNLWKEHFRLRSQRRTRL